MRFVSACMVNVEPFIEFLEKSPLPQLIKPSEKQGDDENLYCKTACFFILLIIVIFLPNCLKKDKNDVYEKSKSEKIQNSYFSKSRPTFFL